MTTSARAAADLTEGVVPRAATNEQAAERPRHRRWRRIVLIAGAAVAAAVLARRLTGPANQPASRRPASPPVPVSVAAVLRQDVPVRLSALGSVVAFNTVTVRPRVDGQLTQVAFTEGQYARRGDLLAVIDPRPFQVQLEQAEGQLARDEAQLNQARTELTRYQLLLAQDSIARTNVDTQAAAVKQLEGALKVDQAAIDGARLNLSFTRVTSPIAGRLGLRQIDAGNLVTAANSSLVVVTETEPIAVIFTLPEDALRIVLPRIRSRTPLPVDVFDRSGATHLASGAVLAVDNEIDQASGTVRLKATFDNRNHALFPDQFVNVQIVADVRRNQLVVPSVAIQQGPQGAFVYVVQDGKAVVRQVAAGIVSADLVSIDRGLEEGMNVIVDGADRLRDGSQLEVRNVGTSSRPSAAAPGRPRP